MRRVLHRCLRAALAATALLSGAAAGDPEPLWEALRAGGQVVLIRR